MPEKPVEYQSVKLHPDDYTHYKNLAAKIKTERGLRKLSLADYFAEASKFFEDNRRNPYLKAGTPGGSGTEEIGHA